MIKFNYKGMCCMKKIKQFFAKIFRKSVMTAEEEQEVIKKIIKKIKEN